MEGPRAPNESEWNDVVRFLNESLRPGSQWSIATEYPLAITQTNRNNMRIIKENGQVLAHALLKYHFIKTPIGLFKVGAIGSVVTHTAHRGRGLSHAILTECLEAAQKELCDFVILWSNLHDFYRKVGFELAGSEVALWLDQDVNVPTENLRFMQSHQISAEALQRLYSQHTVGSMRSIEELRKYLLIPGMRVFTAWDSMNQLQAYAVEGKGIDLKNHIHEWGGGVSKLLPLLFHMRKTIGENLTVIAPAHAQNLIAQLHGLGVSAHYGHLGMIKILNFKGMADKICRWARAKGFEEFAMENQGDKFVISYKKESLQLSSYSELVKLIFGPEKPTVLLTAPQSLKTALDEIFPMPMWIWGWDSV